MNFIQKYYFIRMKSLRINHFKMSNVNYNKKHEILKKFYF